MAVNTSLTSESFSNGVRRNGYIRKGNPFFNTTGNKGYSTCIQGNPVRTGANVLCNCTGLAAGAFNESFIQHKYGTDSSAWPSDKFPYEFRNAACYFLDGIRIQYHKKYDRDGFNKNILDYPNEFSSLDASTSQTNWGDSSVADLYHYIVPVTDTPPVGGIIVWGGGNTRHVAYISRVVDKDKIEIVQAGYNTPIWSQESTSGNGWCCDTRTITRGDSNLWKYQATVKTGTKCLGFIANPAISDPLPDGADPLPDPDDSDNTVTTDYGVYIKGKFYRAKIYDGTRWVDAKPMIYYGGKWNKSVD